MAERTTKTKNLSLEERKGILEALLLRTHNQKDRKLKRGAINEVASLFDCTRLSVSRVWHRAEEEYRSGKVCADVSSNVSKKSGRKPKDYSQNLADMKNVPFNRRGTLRTLSCAIGVPTTTLYERLTKQKELRRVTSRIKPRLTEEN
jgi:hypothetical protein